MTNVVRLFQSPNEADSSHHPQVNAASVHGNVAAGQNQSPAKKTVDDFVFGKQIGEGSFSTVSYQHVRIVHRKLIQLLEIVRFTLRQTRKRVNANMQLKFVRSLKLEKRKNMQQSYERKKL